MKPVNILPAKVFSHVWGKGLNLKQSFQKDYHLFSWPGMGLHCGMSAAARVATNMEPIAFLPSLNQMPQLNPPIEME